MSDLPRLCFSLFSPRCLFGFGVRELGGNGDVCGRRLSLNVFLAYTSLHIYIPVYTYIGVRRV